MTVQELIDSLSAVNPSIEVKVACEPLPYDVGSTHPLKGMRAIKDVDGTPIVVLSQETAL